MRYYQDRTRRASAAIEDSANEKVFKEANKAFKEAGKLPGSSNNDENNKGISNFDDETDEEDYFKLEEK